MSDREVVHTEKAPQAIGTYSQAIKVHNTVYLSGQIPLLPNTMEIISNDIADQIQQVFINLAAVCEAADGNLNNLVKLNIYLTDLSHFTLVNEIMASYLKEPYPARVAIGVQSLPKNALVEMDGILVI